MCIGCGSQLFENWSHTTKYTTDFDCCGSSKGYVLLRWWLYAKKVHERYKLNTTQSQIEWHGSRPRRLRLSETNGLGFLVPVDDQRTAGWLLLCNARNAKVQLEHEICSI